MAVKPARPSPGKKREDERTTGVKSRVTPGRVQPSPARPQVGVSPYIPPNLTPRPAAPSDNFTPMTQEPDLLPTPPPVPIQQTFTPFVHATRTDEGPVLWRGPQGNAVQPGDILPNLQQALSPIFRPRATQAEMGGMPTADERAQATALARAGTNPALLPVLLAQPSKTLNAAIGALGTAQRSIAGPPEQAGTPLGALRSAGAAVAGIPQAALKTFDTVARTTEHAIGSGAASLGVYVNPVQVMTGRMTGPLLARVAQAAARAVGAEELARQLEGAAELPASNTAELVANGIARVRANGGDATTLENVLEVLAPNQDREALVQRQADFISLEPGEGRLWDAAEWTYEGSSRVVDAAERLAAGESWETVSSDIEDSLTGRERLRDVMGQMIYDPLNLFDLGLKLGPLGGGVAERVAKWANLDVSRVLAQTPDGSGLRTLEQFGDIVPANFFEQLPLVGRVIARTPEARAWRVAEEGAGLVQTIFSGIAPDAARRLADLGVDAHPNRVALEILMDPDAANVLASGRSADELRQALGLAAHRVSPQMARDLNLNPDTIIDMFRSDAADRTRHLLTEMQAPERARLYDEFAEVRQRMYDALREGKISDREAAEVELVNWMERFDGTVREVLGITPPTGPFAKYRQAMNHVQGFFVNFHMRFNPGWAIRNIANNTVTLFLDRANILTPRRMVRQQLADLDLLSPALGRSLGAGADTLADQGWAKAKNFVWRFSSDGEREAGYRALLTGFQRTMNRYWRVGDAIPEREFAQFAQAVGPDLAHRAQVLIENARTPEQLRAVRGLLTNEDAWRVLDDPDLARELAKSEIADDVLEIIGQEAADPRDAVSRLDAYVQDLQRGFQDIASKQAALEGTDQAEVQAAVFAALDGLKGSDTERFYNDFWKEQTTFYAQKAMLEAWVDQALDVLREKDIDAFRELEQQVRQARSARRTAMEAGRRAENMRVAGLIREQNFDELAQIDPIFAGVGSTSDAWNRHAIWNTLFWREIDTGIVSDLERLGDEVQAAAGLFTPKPDLSEVRRYVPLTAPEQRQRWATLLSEWNASVDDSIVHLRNFLRKEGILDGDRFFSSDIANEAWYERALEAIRERAGREKPVARGATPLADDYLQARAAQEGLTPEDVADIRVGAPPAGASPIDVPQVKVSASDPRLNRNYPIWVELPAEQAEELYEPLLRAWAEIAYPENPDSVLDVGRQNILLRDGRISNNSIIDEEAANQVAEAWQRVIDDAYRVTEPPAAPLPLPEAPPAPRTPPIRDARGMPADAVNPEAAKLTERLNLLQQVVDNVTRRAGQKAPTLTPEQVKAVDDLLGALEPRMASMRQMGTAVGQAMRDFALHNYGDRRGFDMLLGVLYNYPFWYSRTLANYVRRALDAPGSVAALMKLQIALERANRDAPEWFRDQLSLKTPLGPVYLPILQTLNPLNGFLGDKFHDPDLDNTVPGQVLSRAQMYGPGLHASLGMLMGAWAYARHEKEEALGWFGYLGAPTRAFNAMTVLARQAGADFIPPGGTVLEPWLWASGEEGLSPFVGYDKWEARRIGLGLADLVGTEVDGQVVTAEMAYDAMLRRSGPIYAEALQRSREARAIQTLASFFFGAGVKWRPEIEVEVQRMDAMRSDLYLRRDELSPEQYRQGWAELERMFPWADFVIGFRRDEEERQDIYAWSVFNRLPPNAKPYYNALGLSDAEYSDLINTFYESKGIGGFNDDQREQFMLYMRQLGGILALPEHATVEEWNAAREAYNAMERQLDRQFPGASDKQDIYFRLLEFDGRAAADAYLDNPENGDLLAYWDESSRLRSSDPLLGQYYGGIDHIEKMLTSEFRAQMDAKYPGIYELLDEYYMQPASLRGDFLDAHPEVAAYWADQDAFTLRLRDEMDALADPIRELQPRWAALREDARLDTAGTRDVAALIASGKRPLGDFDLPEDLDARELQAAINVEINSIPDGQWGTVYRELRAMGDLDDILTAYQEWGRGSSGRETIIRNELEARELLAALAYIREGVGWERVVGGDAPGKGTDARTGTSGGSGGYSGSGGGYGSRRADDDGLLVGMPEGMTMDQYADWYTSARWATNEVRDIGKYLAATIESGSPLNPSLMSLSADTRTMVQAFLAATQGQQLDPGAVQDYLAAAVGANDPAAGLDALPPALHGPASQLGAAFLAELAERMGGGSSGGGGSRGGRVRSSSYGGASEQPQTEAQENALHAQIHAFMTDLRRRAPTFWNHLRNMANMSESELAAFLSDPANAHFKRWLLEQVYPRYGTQMAALMTYFKERGTPPAASSGYNRPYSRAGASQRWGVNYAA